MWRWIPMSPPPVSSKVRPRVRAPVARRGTVPMPRGGGVRPHGDAGRRAFTLLEVAIAMCLVVAVLLPLWNMIGSSHRQLSRMEDLVQFQNEGARILDAAALKSFRFVRREAPLSPGAASPLWQAWQNGIVGQPRPGTRMTTWQEEASRNTTRLCVEVKWEAHDRSGRRIEYSTVLRRLLVRPEASLEREVSL